MQKKQQVQEEKPKKKYKVRPWSPKGPRARQCTANSKQSGERCRNSAIIGAETCRMHNGQASLKQKGAANPNWRHGKYVKGEPKTSLQKQYVESLNSPNLLSVLDEVAIIDAQLVGIVAEFSENASWESMIALWAEFKTAVSNKESDKQRRAISSIDNLVNNAEGNIQGLQNFNSITDNKRRLVESELKNMMAKGLLVSIEQLQALQTMQLIALKEVLLKNADKETAVNVLRAYSAKTQEMAVQPLVN